MSGSADPLAGVQIADAVDTRDDLASLAVAVGLGIEAEMRGVNLLPAPRVEKRQAAAQSGLRSTNGIAAAAGAVLVLVAVLLALGFVQGRSDVSDRRATLEGLEAQVAQKQAAASVSAAVAAQAQAHLAAFTAASSGRSNWDGLLDQLARVMPQGVWLDTMQLTPGATVAPATTGNATSAVVTTNGLSPSGAASAPAGTTLHGHRERALAGRGRARPRPARAHPGAVRRVAPVDAAGRRRRQEGNAIHDRRQRAHHGRERLMKDKLTPKLVAALGVAAVAAVALVGWFGLVSPQRSKAAELDSRIADAQTQLVVLNGTTRSPSGASTVGASSSVLTRAMPRSVAMSTVLRQLQRAAGQAGVRLDSLTPQAATAQIGYSTVPMDVVVTGRYLGVQRFLKHLRTQAGVSGSRAHASGRLFSVDSVSLAAGEDQLPQLAATIHLNVFTYSGSAGAAAPTATPTPTSEDDSTSVSASAAGRTP